MMDFTLNVMKSGEPLAWRDLGGVFIIIGLLVMSMGESTANPTRSSSHTFESQGWL